MVIGERLRNLREKKNFSQGEIEKRTGLLRCYISRVENGHTVPAVETLEKFARALEVPMYHLFYEGDRPPKALKKVKPKPDPELFGASGKEARLLGKFRTLLARTDERSQGILLDTAKRMAKRSAIEDITN
jgi:transcriptional regulator with XRE-family HTH domain